MSTRNYKGKLHVKNVVTKLMTTLLSGASNPEADGMYAIAPVYSEGDSEGDSVLKPSSSDSRSHLGSSCEYGDHVDWPNIYIVTLGTIVVNEDNFCQLWCF